jgi:DNA (cytosine-5)-methyltransferase 1
MALGYDAEWHCITAASVGAPHQRDRTFIVAYPGSQRSPSGVAGQDTREEGGGAIVSDDCCPEGGSPEAGGRHHTGEPCPNHWQPEPNVGRVAHGIPHRVDRLKCLGNAIVPQVAYRIFRAIEATA